MHNAAVLLRPLPFDRPGDTLEEVEGFFDGHGTGEAYLWSARPTPDLRRRGWVLEGHPPLLLRPPGGPPPAPVPPGLRAERVTGVDGLRDWERVAVDGFPYRELQPWRPGVLLDERVLADGRLRLWVGYEGDRPVCMAGVRLADEPDLPAVGIFSDMSRAPAEALGFVALTRFTLWHRPRPPAQSVTVTS